MKVNESLLIPLANSKKGNSKDVILREAICVNLCHLWTRKEVSFGPAVRLRHRKVADKGVRC